VTSVWQRLRQWCAARFQSWRREAGPAEPPLPPGLQARCEARIPNGKPCHFALTHSLTADEVICEEGAGMTVNISPSGMQLMMGVAPSRGQLLEVHLDDATLHPSVSLMEVRWTKPVREDLQERLYLVGCRLTFGPSRYWAF
jgi:hypothetical protein